jgi:glutathione synthase/RimK-type ligase-like ATP-grasp enzyme
MALREFEPIRGRIYQARRHTKLQEYQRMVAGGVETPVSVLVEPGVVLDPESWGPFTVLKPLVGGQGRGVRLSRTRDVCWVDPESLPPSHPRYGRPLVAQHFVDTGPMARSHRVMLVLGEPVYSLVSAALTARPVLDPDGREPLDLPIASNAGERTLELNFEPDVITFSRRAARCFPEFACLGVDIVREAASGRLFALEVNTSGSVWHISSDYAAPQRTQLDLDLHGQFGAVDIIANALIETTRRDAV